MTPGNARVLVVGAGGIGCPAALALAHAGVGTLALADDDEVERSNLHRQILFDDADVGARKTTAAAGALRREVPGVVVVDVGHRVLPTNAVDTVGAYDLVLEGSDNFATKFLVADACHLAGVPVVQAAAVRWHGTVLASVRGGRPCYRCVFEDPPTGDAVPNCAEAGVMGPVVGVVGALAADLALAILRGDDVAGTLVSFDGKLGSVRSRRMRPRASCPLCGNDGRISSVLGVRYEGTP
ncbi:MAG: HesA/MoeB/ThiF family protein [Polyangiaceae bacterium]